MFDVAHLRSASFGSLVSTTRHPERSRGIPKRCVRSFAAAALGSARVSRVGFGVSPSGSVPEIIVEGETGFIVVDIDRGVEAVAKIEQISRARCRREFERRLTDRHMAQDYVRIYRQLLSRSSTRAAA